MCIPTGTGSRGRPRPTSCSTLQTAGAADNFSILDYVGFGRVVSLSIVIGVIDVILMTAIATVMAFLYNICSALVGGIQLTLTDD